eukprot:g11498.t1
MGMEDAIIARAVLNLKQAQGKINAEAIDGKMQKRNRERQAQLTPEERDNEMAVRMLCYRVDSVGADKKLPTDRVVGSWSVGSRYAAQDQDGRAKAKVETARALQKKLWVGAKNTKGAPRSRAPASTSFLGLFTSVKEQRDAHKKLQQPPPTKTIAKIEAPAGARTAFAQPVVKSPGTEVTARKAVAVMGVAGGGVHPDSSVQKCQARLPTQFERDGLAIVLKLVVDRRLSNLYAMGFAARQDYIREQKRNRKANEVRKGSAELLVDLAAMTVQAAKGALKGARWAANASIVVGTTAMPALLKTCTVGGEGLLIQAAGWANLKLAHANWEAGKETFGTIGSDVYSWGGSLWNEVTGKAAADRKAKEDEKEAAEKAAAEQEKLKDAKAAEERAAAERTWSGWLSKKWSGGGDETNEAVAGPEEGAGAGPGGRGATRTEMKKEDAGAGAGSSTGHEKEDGGAEAGPPARAETPAVTTKSLQDYLNEAGQHLAENKKLYGLVAAATVAAGTGVYLRQKWKNEREDAEAESRQERARLEMAKTWLMDSVKANEEGAAAKQTPVPAAAKAGAGPGAGAPKAQAKSGPKIAAAVYSSGARAIPATPGSTAGPGAAAPRTLARTAPAEKAASMVSNDQQPGAGAKQTPFPAAAKAGAGPGAGAPKAQAKSGPKIAAAVYSSGARAIPATPGSTAGPGAAAPRTLARTAPAEKAASMVSNDQQPGAGAKPTPVPAAAKAGAGPGTGATPMTLMTNKKMVTGDDDEEDDNEEEDDVDDEVEDEDEDEEPEDEEEEDDEENEPGRETQKEVKKMQTKSKTVDEDNEDNEGKKLKNNQPEEELHQEQEDEKEEEDEEEEDEEEEEDGEEDEEEEDSEFWDPEEDGDKGSESFAQGAKVNFDPPPFLCPAEDPLEELEFAASQLAVLYLSSSKKTVQRRLDEAAEVFDVKRMQTAAAVEQKENASVVRAPLPGIPAECEEDEEQDADEELSSGSTGRMRRYLAFDVEELKIVRKHRPRLLVDMLFVFWSRGLLEFTKTQKAAENLLSVSTGRSGTTTMTTRNTATTVDERTSSDETPAETPHAPQERKSEVDKKTNWSSWLRTKTKKHEEPTSDPKETLPVDKTRFLTTNMLNPGQPLDELKNFVLGAGLWRQAAAEHAGAGEGVPIRRRIHGKSKVVPEEELVDKFFWGRLFESHSAGHFLGTAYGLKDFGVATGNAEKEKETNELKLSISVIQRFRTQGKNFAIGGVEVDDEDSTNSNNFFFHNSVDSDCTIGSDALRKGVRQHARRLLLNDNSMQEHVTEQLRLCVLPEDQMSFKELKNLYTELTKGSQERGADGVPFGDTALVLRDKLILVVHRAVDLVLEAVATNTKSLQARLVRNVVGADRR